MFYRSRDQRRHFKEEICNFNKLKCQDHLSFTQTTTTFQ